jgi:glutathione S-transferase
MKHRSEETDSMERFTLYGNSDSGNCLKAKWAADRLGLACDWVEVDTFSGETRTDAFLALNPAGQVPVLQRADGQTLAQSNAIIRYLAAKYGQGTGLYPEDLRARAAGDPDQLVLRDAGGVAHPELPQQPRVRRAVQHVDADLRPQPVHHLERERAAPDHRASLPPGSRRIRRDRAVETRARIPHLHRRLR